MSSTPLLTPSTRNWTPATPTLSDASAVTFTMSTTCALFVGDVIATVGADVSGAATVTFLAADVVELLAASRARAVKT